MHRRYEIIGIGQRLDPDLGGAALVDRRAGGAEQGRRNGSTTSPVDNDALGKQHQPVAGGGRPASSPIAQPVAVRQVRSTKTERCNLAEKWPSSRVATSDL